MSLKKIIYGLEERGYLGPCAKRRVVCRITAADGSIYTGENYCASPQKSCPRLPGEGYDKCKSICKQPAHAEEVALAFAGDKAKGATVTIEGHSRVCDKCLNSLNLAGIDQLAII